jgi:hypothetical protein
MQTIKQIKKKGWNCFNMEICMRKAEGNLNYMCFDSSIKYLIFEW